MLLPAYPPRFGKVCILGLGKTGAGVARFCQLAMEQGNPVVEDMVIYAGGRNERTEAAAQPFISSGAQVVFDDENVASGFDTCVVSPGIPQRSAFYESALGSCAQVMSEPEFAYLLSPRNWIAITGTNGKTTTTALTAALLRAAHIDAQAVGNIGDTCIDAVICRRPGEYLVAELSSYQLASTHHFSPRVAVLLNITPDHLAWHGSHEAYIDAKMKVFDNLEFDALAVVDVTNPDAAKCAAKLAERGVRLLRIDTGAAVVTTDAAGLSEGTLTVNLQGRGTSHLVTCDELPIKGAHNVVDALAASSAAIFCGANPDDVRSGLLAFKPLEHRIEPCGVVNGVSFYDDSKATNTDAVLKALTAFGDRPLILLLGGRDKGTDLGDLVRGARTGVRSSASERRRRGSFRFEGASIEVLSAPGMIPATDLAASIAHPGDVIALSPACASFDEFDSFEQRGDVFKRHVAGLTEDAR